MLSLSVDNCCSGRPASLTRCIRQAVPQLEICGRATVGVNTEQITASDIIGWDSLGDVAGSLEKRGLKPRSDLGAHNERVLELGDDEYIVVIEAAPEESADQYVPESTSRHTNIVATDDFGTFTFISRVRSWQEQKHGNIQYQRFSFDKEEFRQGLKQEDQILGNINAIRYRSSTPPIERVRQGSKRALTYVRNLI